MSDYIILGDGVAALTHAYHLVRDKKTNFVVVGNSKKWNLNLGGARFLHVHDSEPFNALISDMNAEPLISRLMGGIQLCTRSSKDFIQWSELIDHPDQRMWVTKVYAESTGRDWEPTILNNLCSMDEMPCGLTNPSYQAMINYMHKIVRKSRLCKMMVASVSEVDNLSKKISLDTGDVLNFDTLVNTMPFWVFQNLLRDPKYPKIDIKYSSPRYAFSEKASGPQLSMVYYVGDEVEKHTGMPIKRVSTINGERIVELYDKPANNVNVTRLPPNIKTPDTAVWLPVEQGLLSARIILLGRYAQMRSKMMFTDIIDESARITGAL